MRITINRSTCKIAVVLLGVVLLGVLFLFGMTAWERYYNEATADTEGIYDGDGSDLVYMGENCYAPNKRLKTVLLMGVDKFEVGEDSPGYMNDKRADFLMLLIFDEKNEKCTALHINRDTMAEIQMLDVRGKKSGTFTGQLSLAHTYGSGSNDSCRNVVTAVEKLLYGIDIDHYISFTMEAVPKVNDIAGGVTLELLDDFTSVDPTMVKGATVTLEGNMALTYVRSRYGLSNATNEGRMERQVQYLTELKKKLAGLGESDENFFGDILKTLSDYMVSDCTVNQLSDIYEKTEKFEDGGFLSIKGESTVGDKHVEFYPDEDALQNQVIELFYVPVTVSE